MAPLPRLNHYLFVLLGLLFSSCVPYESIVNFSDTESIPKEAQIIQNYQPLTIQPNDILEISVTSLEQQATEIFNSDLGGYLVSLNGSIQFPVIGELYLAGKTTEEAKALILENLSGYFKKPPIVNLRLANFKVYVNGEVSNPGMIAVNNERLTVFEALTLAGDFTIYSKRDSVLIIREEAEGRTYRYVNFDKLDVVNSPYFYLKQNDVVYVAPTEKK